MHIALHHSQVEKVLNLTIISPKSNHRKSGTFRISKILALTAVSFTPRRGASPGPAWTSSAVPSLPHPVHVCSHPSFRFLLTSFLYPKLFKLTLLHSEHTRVWFALPHFQERKEEGKEELLLSPSLCAGNFQICVSPLCLWDSCFTHRHLRLRMCQVRLFCPSQFSVFLLLCS